jgi:hypothetical protein
MTRTSEKTSERKAADVVSEARMQAGPIVVIETRAASAGLAPASRLSLKARLKCMPST